MEGQRSAEAGDMTQKSILLVDDEPMVRRVLRLALEKADYRVEVACNGEEAIEKIMHSTPDVVITDIEMPVMTGEEFCKRLAEDFPNRTFPVFVATSLTDLEHRRWSNAIDNLYFLEKPLSAKRLVSAIAATLSGEALA
jgi:CheY-like chemotaxis protein